MSKLPIPALGEPIFRISSNSMSNKVMLSNSEYLNDLIYFAVDAVKVMALEFPDHKDTSKVLINKDMRETDELDSPSLEFLTLLML